MAKIDLRKIILKSPPNPIASNENEVTKKKVQLPEYKELFQALFKIKNEKLRNRILNAINGVDDLCAQCGKPIKQEPTTETDKSPGIIESKPIIKRLIYVPKQHSISNDGRVSCSTQTVTRDFLYLNKVNNIKTEDELSTLLPAPTIIGQVKLEKDVDTTDTEIVTPKLGRPRLRNNVPYAGKAEISTNPTRNSSNSKKKSSDTSNGSKESFEEQVLNIAPFESDQFDDMEMFPLLLSDNISMEQTPIGQMIDEWENALVPKNGLLRIHRAAKNNDINLLKRQLLVFQFLKKPICIRAQNAEGNTPLHYAIYSNDKNLSTQTIDLLLKHDDRIIYNTPNNDGDNALHYAAKLSDDCNLFRRLLENIDVNRLDDLNSDGYSVLHLLVMQNKFEFVHILLKRIDDELKLTTVKDADGSINSFITIILNYKRLPKLFCNNINPIKYRIVNQGDQKSRRSALFHAVNNEEPLMICMLLAHIADPLAVTLSNETPISLANELKLNPKTLHFMTNMEFLHHKKYCVLKRKILNNGGGGVGADDQAAAAAADETDIESLKKRKICDRG